MTFKAILFDLDGTLLDTLDDLADSMNATLTQMGFPTHAVERYKYFVGDGIVMLVRRALPASTDEAAVVRAVDVQRQEYGRRWANKTRLYAGIPELLDALTARGLKRTIFSNKPDNFTRVTVEKFLSRWTFAVIRGERPPTPVKPDPAGALNVAEELGLSPAEFIYLGDTNTDMACANAADMYAVGALWGFRTAEELQAAGARKLLRRPIELLDLLA